MNNEDMRTRSAEVDAMLSRIEASITGGDYGACERAVESITDQYLLETIAIYASHPITRFLAVKKLTNQAVLAICVKTDEEVNVRYAAVEKLTDQTILADFAKNTTDSSIREIAAKRLLELKV